MKKIFKVLLIALLLGGGIVTENQVKAQSVTVSLSIFQNALSPYGRWVNHGRYGQVWIVNQRNFVPYETGGHWAYTDYGWTWVSDYDWGWAPFHYGRWNWEPSLGWYWVPDYDWGPAWVAWRDNGDYYGWAPLAPGLNISVGVSYASRIPSARWVFAPRQYITSPYINRYYVPRTRNVTIIKNKTFVNNVVVKNIVHVSAGPRRQDVERVNHTRIKTYRVSNSSRPGKTVVNNNTVNVYRPVVNKTTVNNNNKTVVNKNSNNTTVKNSNNKSISKTNNKTVVNKDKNAVNKNEETTINKDNSKKTVNRNTVKKNNNTTVKKNLPANKNVKQKQQNNKAVNKNVDSNKRPPTVNNNKKPMVNDRKTTASNSKKATIKKRQQTQHKNAVKPKNNNDNHAQVKKQQKQNQQDSNNKGKKK
jgi:hypothetical protein